MHKKFIYDLGGHIEESVGDDEWRHVPFPVCLVIGHGDNVSAECPNFILSIDESWVFVITNTPLPEGSQVTMLFTFRRKLN